jgi:hypothetical protein
MRKAQDISSLDSGLMKRKIMKEKSSLRVLNPFSDNPKSKIENGWGLSPSLSHSRCVGLRLTRSRQEKPFA